MATYPRLTTAGRYDPGERRQATRQGRQRGVYVYLPAVELRAAGIDPDSPPPLYRTHGFRRSVNGHTVLVSLYPPSS